jgi:two-component system cell cycle sensor histidine kinase/response regulator CckA
MDVVNGQPKEREGDLDVIRLIAEFDKQTAHLSFNEIAKGALRFMAERLRIGRASVALLRDDGEGFRMFEASGDVLGFESGTIVAPGSGLLGKVVKQQRPFYRADIRQGASKKAVDEALLASGFLCTFSVPLISGGRCLGTLNAAVKSVDGIDPETRMVIELLAPRLAYALAMGIALDALAESEARFRDVFDTVGDGIIVADVSNRKFVMANSAICNLLGHSAREMLALGVNDIHPKERVEEVVQVFEAMARGEQDHAMEVPMLHKNGTVVLADVSARRTVISNKRCVVGAFRDATVRLQREDEQLQVQKLESIRTLAAGIAHDFNNLLTGLIGNISLAQLQLDKEQQAWELLDEAQRAATRGTALTRQLLTFAKGGAPVRRPTDIAQVVRDSANLAVSGSNVQCRFDPPSETYAVTGDEGQLAQVFQNLVRNAVEAMPGGGVVEVHVSRQKSKHGDEVCVEVADHGPGIAPEALDKIFTPFFTTKDKGSGLGLAVAFSIVQNHGGRIQVSSKPGAGTMFRVSLPAYKGRGSVPSSAQETQRGVGHILVMDDEAMVVRIAERVLNNVGYQTQGVANGEAAVAAYRRAFTQGPRFDAVILDLTVPGGMGGREAAKKILDIDPNARLMVSSGYSEDSLMAEYRSHGFCAVLPKPYNAKQLCDALQAVLQEDPEDKET